MASGSWNAVLSYVRRLRVPARAEGDGDLLRRFARDRDEAAFAALVRRHGGLVWAVCNRLLPRVPDAEDAFQATFLVLARKAGAVRRPELLGPWLHGVARRTAAKLRAAAYRRQQRECAMAGEPAVEATPDVVWRDLRPVLDEEVGRLPERFRVPFVLCYLEGVSNEEAARRLGCPRGTVLSRLSRARERLRDRLTRRGITLSGSLLAAAVAENAATAAAPAALVEPTVRLGLAFAAGTAAAPAVSLAEGVLHAMWITKLKFAAVLVLAVGVAGSGAGMFAWRARAGQADAPRPDAAAQGKNPLAKQTADPTKAPPPAKQPPEPQPRAPLSDKQLRDALSRPIRYHGIDDPKATLEEALEQLTKTLDVQFDVNERAFRLDNPNLPPEGILHLEIAHPPINAMNAKLEAVLRKLLSRVPANSGATYLIRQDAIEITTSEAVRKELGLPAGRPLLPLVWEDLQEVPLHQALQRLADDSGMSVVLDPAVGVGFDGPGPAAMKVSVRLRNVPVDTAVRILANMAGLYMVRLDNVLYVTTEEKAGVLRDEQKNAEAQLPVFGVPPSGLNTQPAATPKPAQPPTKDKELPKP